MLKYSIKWGAEGVAERRGKGIWTDRNAWRVQRCNFRSHRELRGFGPRNVVPGRCAILHLYFSTETPRTQNMHENLNAWGLTRKLTWQDVLLVLAVLLLARLLVLFVRWAVRVWPKSCRHTCV